MKVNQMIAGIIILFLGANANASSYVVVSGNTISSNTQSNLIVDYELSTYDENLEPGDTGTLTLVISNSGTQDASDVQIYILSTPKIRIEKSFFIGTIKNQAPATVSVSYHIQKDAEVGQHTIPIRLQYDGKDANGRTVSNINSNYDFPIKIFGKPKITIENLQIQNPIIGENAVVKVTLKNQKTDAFNVEATLMPADPILGPYVTILGSNRQYIGELKSQQTKDLTYLIHLSNKLESGAYSIPFVVKYENKGHTVHEEKFSIGTYISGNINIGITNLQTDPEIANPGDKNVKIKVKLENTGSTEIENIIMTMHPKNPFKESKSYIQSKNIGLLKTRNYSELDFYIDVDENAKEGVYGLDYSVSYKVNSKEYIINKTVDMVIKQKPDFELNKNMIKASENEDAILDFEVKNIGSDCDSVTIWVLKKADHPFDFDDKSQLVGDLLNGEIGQAKIGFTVDENANAKLYLLPLEIRCSKDGKVYVKTDKAQIEVVEKQGSGMSVLIYLAVALFTAIGLGGYILIRKKRGEGK